MGTIKEFYKSRPHFFKMIDDSTFLFCVLKNIDYKKEEVEVEKYYVAQREYNIFKNKVFNGCVDGKIDIPKIGHCANTLSFSSFFDIFNISIKEASLNNKTSVINEINAQLSSIALTVRKSKYVRINDFGKLNEELERVFREGSNNIEEIKWLPDDGKEKFLRLFNVGQANCSALYYDKKVVSFFDLGNKNRRNGEPVAVLKRSLSNNEMPVSIIISHFHDDHVNLANYLPFKKFGQVLFIFPFVKNPNNICYKARFLVLAAHACPSKIYFVKESVPVPLIVNNIKLYKGRNMGDTLENDIVNAEGIISSFNLNGKKVVIPGDSYYENWPTKLDADYLVIPHHGSEYVGDLSNIKTEKVKKAFIFSKRNSKYHHPNLVHAKKFTRVELFSNSIKNGQNVMFDKSEMIYEEDLPHGIFFKNNSRHTDWE